MTLDATEWVLDRIIDMFPGQAGAGLAIPCLVEAIDALHGKWAKTVFGLTSITALDPARVDAVIALARDALGAWRAWCVEHDHTTWLPEIDRVT